MTNCRTDRPEETLLTENSGRSPGGMTNCVGPACVECGGKEDSTTVLLESRSGGFFGFDPQYGQKTADQTAVRAV